MQLLEITLHFKSAVLFILSVEWKS